MAEQAAAQPNSSFVRQWLISLFIILNILSVSIWLMPAGMLRNLFEPLVDWYLRFAGLYQGFAVFSPDVNTSHAEIVAVVTMKDGQRVTWVYPKLWQMDLVKRMYKERYRAYATRMLDPENRELLPFAALYIAQDVYRRLGRRQLPAEVGLKVIWKRTPAPGAPGAETTTGGCNTFYRYTVGDAL